MERKRNWVGLLGWVLLGSWVWAAPDPGEVFSWEGEGATEWYPGIRHAHVRVSEPRLMNIHAVRVDLRSPQIGFAVTGRSTRWGEQMPGGTNIRGGEYPSYTAEADYQTTRDFVYAQRDAGRPVVVGINADAFSPWPPSRELILEGGPSQILGLAISDGVLVSPARRTASLLIDKEGRARIEVTRPDETNLEGIRWAVSGFGICLREGELLGNDERLAPRTGYGLDGEADHLILLTIDGRQPGVSEGATIRDVGRWLQFFGAATGINMDGGGSTSLARWIEATDEHEGGVYILNRTVGHGLPGSERAVGNNFGVTWGDPPPGTAARQGGEE